MRNTTRPLFLFTTLLSGRPEYHQNGITDSFPALHGTNSGCCTLVVRYLYNICTIEKRTTSGQQLYKYCTTTGVGPSQIQPNHLAIPYRKHSLSNPKICRHQLHSKKNFSSPILFFFKAFRLDFASRQQLQYVKNIEKQTIEQKYIIRL